MDEIYCLEKLITNCDKELLQITRAHFTTNCDMGLLQIATGALLQIATSLLQIAAGIANCDDRYYKLRQVLQIATLLQIATVQSIYMKKYLQYLIT